MGNRRDRQLSSADPVEELFNSAVGYILLWGIGIGAGGVLTVVGIGWAISKFL